MGNAQEELGRPAERCESEMPVLLAAAEGPRRRGILVLQGRLADVSVAQTHAWRHERKYDSDCHHVQRRHAEIAEGNGEAGRKSEACAEGGEGGTCLQAEEVL